MIPVVLGLLGIGLVMGLLSAPADASQLPARSAAEKTVYIQGDSLTVGSRGWLLTKLRRTGHPVTVDAQTSRTTATGLARTTSSWDAKRARVWVMALGTNDAPSPSLIKSYVRRTLRAAGKNRHVIWVTVKRPGGYYLVNRMLRDYARSHPRLHLVGWAKYVRNRPWLLQSDRVHATATGYKARARLIAKKSRRVLRSF